MFAKSLLVAAMAAVASAQLLINTPPALFTCQPYAVTWSGGVAPYFVSVIPGGDQSAAPLLTLGDQPTTANSYVWTVNLAAGTSITLRISDQAGVPAFSAPITIQAGSSTSCVGQPPASGSGAASSAPASSAPAGSSSAASSSAPATSVAASSASMASSSAPMSSASSAASSAMSSASSRASSASGAVGSVTSSAAAAATSRPASAGNKVAFSGLALFGAAALAVVA